MGIVLSRLSPGPQPRFERLLAAAWESNWDEELTRAIVRWRYYLRSNGETWVLLDGEQCVGLLDAMPRPYLLDGKRILVQEIGDWFCLPEYRTGSGLRLLRAVMDQDQPILVIGGSSAALRLFPKLGFVQPSSAGYHVLPVTARGLAANLARQVGRPREHLARFVPNCGLLFPRRLHRPSGAEVRAFRGDQELRIPFQRDGLVQIIEPEHWEWLCRMPRELAMPLGLTFFMHGHPVGCSIAQLEPTATGLDGRVVHLQWQDQALANWIVSETVASLSQRGAGFIRCCVTTPEKRQAIEAAGFMFSKPAPISWFSRSMECPPSVDAGYLRGDDNMPWGALRARHWPKRQAA